MVGYQSDIAVNDGYTPIGGAFVNIGEQVFPIANMEASGVADSALQLWVVDSNLSSTSKAYFFNAWQDLPAGWFNDDGSVEVSADIAMGSGVLLKTGTSGVTALQRGEVSTNGVPSLAVNDGYTILANPYAVPLPIANLVATGVADSALQLWVVDSNLSSTSKAYFFNAWQDLPAGWFNDDGSVEISYSIPVGGAVLLKTGTTGVTLSIKSPITSL